MFSFVTRIQRLMMALSLLFGSIVTGCFPLFSPAGCGGGGGCCAPPGCIPPAVGGYDPSPYSMPAYGGGSYGPAVPYKSRSMAMGASSQSSSIGSSTDSACLRRYADTRLSPCALQFERRIPSDEQQCQRHCLDNSPRCRSFQYDPLGSVCDLFEHSLGAVSDPLNSIDDEWNLKKKSSKKNSAAVAVIHRRRKRFFLHSGVPLDKQAQQMLRNSPLGPMLASGVPSATSSSSSFLPYSAPSLSSSPSSSSLPYSPPPLSSPFLPYSSSCVPTLESRPGSVFVAFDSDCGGTTSTPDPFLLSDEDGMASDERDDHQIPVPLPAPPPPPTVPPSPYSRAGSSSPSSGSLEPFTAFSSASPHSSSAVHRHWSTGGAAVEEVESGARDCPADGARARVQLIDGIALAGQTQATARVKAESADACLQICRQNALLDGRRLSVSCRAATFHRQSGHCELLPDAISPNGALQYVPNPDSLYFEKICIPRRELAPGCDDVIHRIPQHHLDPRQVANGGSVESAQTQLDCVRKCISAKARSGLDCSSVSFFFDSTSQNCYLSRHTRLSRPDLYAAERVHLVDYMEMPPCFQLPIRPIGSRQHDVPTEPTPPIAMMTSTATVATGGWSPCIGGVRWRKTVQGNCTKGKETGCSVEREQCGGNGAGGTAVGKQQQQVQAAEIQQKEEDDLDADIGLKQIAPSIEVAKRFHAPPVASEEASLFGEQDYDNQKEISFFGPPHQPASNRQFDNQKDTNSLGAEPNAQPLKAACDPHVQCCPIDAAGAEGPQGLIRGCSLGSRVLEDGRTVTCVPNDCQ